MTSRYLASSWVAGDDTGFGVSKRSQPVSNSHGSSQRISHDAAGKQAARGVAWIADTYRAEGDGGSGQADQPSVPGMGLMDGVGKVITELVEDGLNPQVVLLSDKIADEPF